MCRIDKGIGFRVDRFRVLPERNRIEWDGGHCRVEPKVMAVLVALARRPGELVAYDTLIDEVWGAAGATADLASRAVGRLRRVLNAAGHVDVIETVRGRGYCLTAHVQVLSRDDLDPAPAASAPPPQAPTRRLTPATASAASFAACAATWAIVCLW